MSKRAVRSLTAASPRVSDWKIARRLGSASAWKILSSATAALHALHISRGLLVVKPGPCSSQLESGAQTGALGVPQDDVCGGHVLDAEAERLEERDLLPRPPSLGLTREHLADLGQDVRVVHGALRSREEEVARLAQHRLAPVDEEPRAHDRGRVQLAPRGHAGADRVDVRAVRDPGAEDHRLGRRRDRADDVGSFHGLAHRRRRLDGNAVPERGFVREATRAREVAAAHPHAPDRPHQEHRLEVRARLHAGADDREQGGVLARERARRDRRRGRGTDGGDRGRVDDGQ